MNKVVELDNRDTYIATSRYKNANYFQVDVPNYGPRVESSTWDPPEIPESALDQWTSVGAGEEGRLDLVALRVYRLEDLWWVIALANNILDPFSEVTSGLNLRYPSFDWVAANVLA